MHKVGTQGRRVPLGNSLSLGSSTKHLVALTSLSHCKTSSKWFFSPRGLRWESFLLPECLPFCRQRGPLVGELTWFVIKSYDISQLCRTCLWMSFTSCRFIRRWDRIGLLGKRDLDPSHWPAFRWWKCCLALSQVVYCWDICNPDIYPALLYTEQPDSLVGSLAQTWETSLRKQVEIFTPVQPWPFVIRTTIARTVQLWPYILLCQKVMFDQFCY